MKRFMFLIPAISVILIALSMPARATEEPVWRMDSNQICIQTNTPTKGWRLNLAIKAWNATGHVRFYRSGNCAYYQAPTVFITVVPEHQELALAHWPVGPVRWEGTTSIYSRTDVVLNQGKLDSYSSKLRKCIAWRATTHELGHTLGLSHNHYADSIMYEVGHLATSNCSMRLWSTDAWLASQIGY